MTDTPEKIQRGEAEWRKLLTPGQYRILREKDTERPFTGALTENHETGNYHCAGCGTLLFMSGAKFDSGCGWPSFMIPADSKAVEEHEDVSLGMRRVEVTCARCGGHLGHVFPDGPRPTGLRYCINSGSLTFTRQDPWPAAVLSSPTPLDESRPEMNPPRGHLRPQKAPVPHPVILSAAQRSRRTCFLESCCMGGIRRSQTVLFILMAQQNPVLAGRGFVVPFLSSLNLLTRRSLRQLERSLQQPDRPWLSCRS
jgi:peptide-methionine (R)-S-oxide reductase